MSPKPRSYVRALALLGLLTPTPAMAQTAEGCGIADTLLMHCTFDNATKQVRLCLNDDTINYQFGPDIREPELTLTAGFNDVDYVPYGWASNTIFESVMLRNGNTTYEVYASVPRGPDAGMADGGIHVTKPDGSTVNLVCDRGSVVPNDPLAGIGQLTAFVSGHGDMLLTTCLTSTDDPTSCIGRVRAVEVNQNRCTLGPDPSDCWTTEAAAWDFVLEARITAAQATLADMRGMDFVEKLRAAQISWHATRTFDCALLLTLPFAADGGAAKCTAQYAAKRLQFLQDVVLMAEFDG